MPIQLSRIQAICFDVDGTLSDTDDMFTLRLERILRPVKFLFQDRDAHRAARRLIMWLETPANTLMGVPDTLGLDDEIASLVEWFNRRRPRPMKHFMLVPGVKKMLDTVFKKYPLAVVSARDERSTLQFLDQFHLRRYFQVIVTAQTAEHTKPYPDPVQYAAEKMGVPADACLMVGDTIVDIIAGRRAGAQTVGVLCGFGEEPELRKRGADMILASTAELALVLEE